MALLGHPFAIRRRRLRGTMARINIDHDDSDGSDSFPDLAEVLRDTKARHTSKKSFGIPSSAAIGVKSNPSRTTTETRTKSRSPAEAATPSAKLVPKAGTVEKSVRRQRALKPTSANSLPKLCNTEPECAPKKSEKISASVGLASAIKQTPRRAVREASDSRLKKSVEADDSFVVGDSEDIEESIWCGDDSGQDEASTEEEDDYQSPPPTVRRRRLVSKKELLSGNDVSRKTNPERPPFPPAGSLKLISTDTTETVFKLPPLPLPKPTTTKSFERPSSSSSVDHDAILRFSPPRRRSPIKAPPVQRPSTPSPPPSPSKSRLTSPSKQRTRIPTPPHGPSMDAFWAADLVNDWNDQHSPRKTLTSPRKAKLNLGIKDTAEESDFGAKTSPRKGSPTKADRSAVIARKDFEARKHQLAADFLEELDKVITNGKIGQLAAQCGGVKLEWNKKLNSTAGRANWRRERMPTSTSSEPIHKHHASIELAEKVIDDEDRLFNTIAHEYCHLANFMISNVRDNPHGAEFKAWAAKVTRAFKASHNIAVTTKHTYDIAYKYVWTCSVCGHEFKRHSKSIDTTRHACGSCKGLLVQTKPAVRARDPNKGPNEFQVFLKENLRRVKGENEGLGHKEVMQLLGQMYKEGKAKRGESLVGGGAGAGRGDGDGVEGVARALEVIVLDD